jgi:hydrogenase maturation factor
MDKQGLLLCARYSVAPNYYGYCGPDENLSLVDHLKEQVADKEVSSILSEFETLYQYLIFIATENKIQDPFDRTVVEAYWIGNSLLHKASNFDYISLLREKLSIEHTIGMKKFHAIKRKIISNHFYPHHSFHVFNIFKRTGHDPSIHTLDTMDSCRIAFGKIKNFDFAKAMTNKQKSIVVEYRPLIFIKKKLQFGLPAEKKIKIDYKGKSFLKNLKIGDWVSFHWGFVCDVLTEIKLKNLLYYTQKSIDYFNSPV